LVLNILLVFIGNAIGGALGLAVPVYYANRESAVVSTTESPESIKQVIVNE